MVHETSLKTRYSETDFMGHINNISYFAYLEFARTEFLHDAGIASDGGPWKFVLVSVKCDFLNQLYARQTIRLKTQVSRIGQKSFAMIHEMLTDDGTVAARGESVVVRFDRETQKTLPLERDIVEKLTPYLKQDDR